MFDPLAKYGELSYADFMLHPIADALNAVVASNTRVWLSTQGEMGATVMYYPDSHRQVQGDSGFGWGGLVVCVVVDVDVLGSAGFPRPPIPRRPTPD